MSNARRHGGPPYTVGSSIHGEMIEIWVADAGPGTPSDVIDAVYRHCGQKECVIFADRLMGLGFGQACKAGISIVLDPRIGNAWDLFDPGQ